MSDYLGPLLEDEEKWSPKASCASATLEPDMHTATLTCNVAGNRFLVKIANVQRFPGTRLGKLADVFLSSVLTGFKERSAIIPPSIVQQLLRYCDGFCPESREFFFDRSPYSFDAILNLYRNDVLHLPDGCCPEAFVVELDYWEIEKDWIAPCCQAKLQFLQKAMVQQQESEAQQQEASVVKRASEATLEETNAVLSAKLRCDRNCCALLRKKAWLLLEYPKSSKAATIYIGVSLCFVIATVIILIMSSIPHYQILDPVSNETDVTYGLEIADTVCVAWFTMEHFARLWAVPDRWAYLKSPLCNIDFLAIAPFYIELLFALVGIESKFFGDLRRSFLMMRILRALRVMRVLRVLKVARYSKGFQSVGSTFKKCWKELVMLVLFMFTTNVMFSTVMYFMENENKTPGFQSIPAASWWCIITMTTVGYGDVYPHTIPGKIFAGFVSITGIILLAFPISVIVEHFHEEYSEDKSDPGAAGNAAKPHTVRVFTGMFMCDVPAAKRRVRSIHI